MRVKDLWKKVLIAGVTAGSAMVIAACYGAYYGPRTAPVRGPAVHGPVVHVNQRRPVSCAVRPDGSSPRCFAADPVSPETRPNTIENVNKTRTAPPPAAK